MAEKTENGDGEDQDSTGQAHRGRRAENQAREQGPQAGTRHPGPGWPGEQSPASRHEPDVQNVAKSQV